MFTTAAVLALTITAAQAGSAVTVQYGDLNLSRPADARALSGRIDKAAEIACAQFKSSVASMFYRPSYVRCLRDAKTDTSARIAVLSGTHRAVASK
jgi:UrcA family protein